MAANVFLECDMQLDCARCLPLQFPAAVYMPIASFMASAQSAAKQKRLQKLAEFIFPSKPVSRKAATTPTTTTTGKSFPLVDFILDAVFERKDSKAMKVFTPELVEVLLRVCVNYPKYSRLDVIKLARFAILMFEKRKDPAGLLRCLEFVTEMKWEQAGDAAGVHTRKYLDKKIRMYIEVLLRNGKSFKSYPNERVPVYDLLGMREAEVKDVGRCVFFSKYNSWLHTVVKNRSALIQATTQKEPTQQPSPPQPQQQQGKAKPAPTTTTTTTTPTGNPIMIKDNEYYVKQEIAWMAVIPEILKHRVFKSVDTFLKGGIAEETFSNEFELQINAVLDLAQVFERYKAILSTPQPQQQQQKNRGGRGGGQPASTRATDDFSLEEWVRVLDRFRSKIATSLCVCIGFQSDRRDKVTAKLREAAESVLDGGDSLVSVATLCDQMWTSAIVQPLEPGTQFVIDPSAAFASSLLYLRCASGGRLDILYSKMEEKLTNTVAIERYPFLIIDFDFWLVS